jgi:formate hydrogenlyase subunit 4
MRAGLVNALLALALAPFLLSIINRTKALAAGRRGQPLLQPYRDLAKLLRKGAVYSPTTTWVFRAGPIVALAAMLVGTALVPLGGVPAPLGFAGDLVLFAYLLGAARFVVVAAALDTGSSFEGMGASREAAFSALAEPAFLLGLAVLARQSGQLSLSAMLGGVTPAAWAAAAPAFVLLAVALFGVFLAENARLPFDDPTTHLELTMVHEVMVLDHGGPDLAFVQYGAALKLWLLGALLVGLTVPLRSGVAWLDSAAALAGMAALAVLTGVVESTMARLRLVRVPQMLIGATMLSVVALVLVLR